MSEIHWQKRYIYNLDSELLNGLKTLYFDSKTYELKTQQEFIEKRKDEVVAKLEISPTIVKPKKKVDLTQILANLKLKSDDKESESEPSDIEENENEHDEGESGNDSDKVPSGKQEISDLYARVESSIVETKDEIEESVSTISFMTTKSPMILLSTPLLDDKVLGVYKSLISAVDSPNFDPVAHITNLTYTAENRMPKDPLEAGISAVFMLSSGHFAGAIISHLPHSTKGNKGTNTELQLQSVRLIQHKTFHRYTTRRKQGGSQSAMDDSKGKANSAGSTLRRYNEQALNKEIDDLLLEWKDLLDQCDNVFIRASGKSLQNLVNDKGALKPGDDRIKMIPFTTGRPTSKEIKRVWNELTYLKITDKPKLEKKEMENQRKRLEAMAKSKSVTSSNTEATKVLSHSQELINLIKKSKAPALLVYLKKNKITSDYLLEDMYPTMLHYASAHGLAHMVRILMVQTGANATIVDSTSGKTAWDVANKSKKQEVHWAFQQARFQLGEKYPEEYWVESHIGPAISPDEISKLKESATAKLKQDQINKQKDLEELATQKIGEMRTERVRNIEQKFGVGQTVGAKPQTEEQKLQGLSPEQRMRVMREQRARAMEKRLGLSK